VQYRNAIQFGGVIDPGTFDIRVGSSSNAQNHGQSSVGELQAWAVGVCWMRRDEELTARVSPSYPPQGTSGRIRQASEKAGERLDQRLPNTMSDPAGMNVGQVQRRSEQG
jgi:hypothetical protein